MLDKSMIFKGEITDISPSQPKIVGDCVDATWREVNIAPEYHDNNPDKGRGISVKCGLGNSRILVSLRQCGLTPKELMRKALKK